VVFALELKRQSKILKHDIEFKNASSHRINQKGWLSFELPTRLRKSRGDENVDICVQQCFSVSAFSVVTRSETFAQNRGQHVIEHPDLRIKVDTLNLQALCIFD